MADEPFDVSQLGKGVLPDVPDPRDFRAEAVLGASPPAVFDVEFRLPEPPDENQNSSDSCVSQGTSYYHWQLKGKNYSRRDVFSRIALAYGAYLRDGVKQICTTGQQTRDECPDPNPQTPQNMRVRSDKPDSSGMDDLEANYYVLSSNSIEMVAQAIRDHKGVLFGLYGDSRGGWADMTNPKPPKPNAVDWAHALYGFGFHRHSDGQRCIIAKSSWCYGSGEGRHHEHHIREDYFKAGMTFNAWVVIPKEEEFMTNSIIVKNGGEYGIFDPATSEDGLITLMRNRGIKPPLKEDGTLNWDAVNGMVGGVLTPTNQ